MVIAMTTGVDVVISGWTETQSPITGGEAVPPPRQQTVSRLQAKSRPSRRRRRRWTRSWRGPAELTSPRPSCVWCSSRSLTRAGRTVNNSVDAASTGLVQMIRLKIHLFIFFISVSYFYSTCLLSWLLLFWSEAIIIIIINWIIITSYLTRESRPAITFKGNNNHVNIQSLISHI